MGTQKRHHWQLPAAAARVVSDLDVTEDEPHLRPLLTIAVVLAVVLSVDFIGTIDYTGGRVALTSYERQQLEEVQYLLWLDRSHRDEQRTTRQAQDDSMPAAPCEEGVTVITTNRSPIERVTDCTREGN